MKKKATSHWKTIAIAEDETHHVVNDNPCYVKKFIKVLKFHAPGLAAVIDDSGAYHINTQGEPAYSQRFLQTFGYYDGLAAIEAETGWFHIDRDGYPLYPERYAWCGNFQEGLCTVKMKETNVYCHIDTHGRKTYSENYCYAGDYRDGIAVVCADNGLQTHIDRAGKTTHRKWFLGLDVFHKGIARAKDKDGWFHITKAGLPLYSQRYKVVEPYYNNIAHVEDMHGNVLLIDLTGNTCSSLYQANHSVLHTLSADMVGFWKTQTIYAAMTLGLFDVLPTTLEKAAALTQLEKNSCKRLLRALQELALVIPAAEDDWQLTEKGALLKPMKTSAMAAAALIWGDSHYQRWTHLVEALRSPTAHTTDYFTALASNETLLATYHRALKGYAEQDYSAVLTQIDWSQHQHVIDAGGGTATLLHQLLHHFLHLKGTLLERPEVIALIDPQSRCHYHPADLLKPWPCNADAIVLARVLHDWHDEETLQILRQAKKSLTHQGKIYVIEMLLDPDSGEGGLLDLNMLVMTGGKERSLVEWQQLMSQTQLNITAIYPLSSVSHVLVVEPYAM